MSLDHLVGGAVYGATLAFVAVAATRFTRHILAAVLAVAALAYVWFAAVANAGAGLVTVELAGAGICGFAAMRGVRGSAWWFVTGFALRPVWDVALHLAGAGSVFAPEWYATSCLTFDLTVAAVATIAIVIGTHLTDAPARVPARAPRLRPSPCACNSCPSLGASAA